MFVRPSAAEIAASLFVVSFVIASTLTPAGPAAADPYSVDGLSGATITSNGVTKLVNFWLGEHGYKPFLTKFRAGEGRTI